MIYLKNNTEIQAIYIPRQTVLGGGYIPSTKTYDKGYNDGLEVGKEQQKDKLSNLNVTANGQYEREDGWNIVTVDVPDLNGSYNEGYEQGKTDGANEQKSKLESISITENGTYNKEDGYNHIEVNVPDLNGSYDEGYAQGKTDGINEQKSKLETINITENGTYNREDGYNKIIVEVPDLNGSYDEGYAKGKTYGVNEQKSKLETINITKNGTYNREDGYNHIEVNVPTVQEQSFDYDITAFTYKVYDWTSVNINRNNMTNDCGDRPLDCLLFRNRSGECTVMTKFDTCSGTARLENGWSGDSIILSLKSNSITKFSSNSINSNRLASIDTGFAQLEENAIMNCNALTDIKLAILNDNLSTQFATNCFNGLPAEGTITIGKNVDVTITLTDDEITSFFRTIVGEGWTITIK